MAENVPIDELPAYVAEEPGPAVQHALETGQALSVLVWSVAGLVGAVTGLAMVAPYDDGVLPYAIVAALFMAVFMVGWLAFGEWRWGRAERPGLTVVLPDGSRVARAALTTPHLLVLAGVLLLTNWAVGVLVPLAGGLLAGVMLGTAIHVALRFLRLEQEARRTDWLPVVTREGKRSKWRRARSYLGDGLVVAGLGWTVGTKAPLDQLDVPSLPPEDRWCVLSALGSHEAALAAIVPACGPADPARALLAAVSLVLLDRPGEAGTWVQRAVDDGFREKIHPAFAEALKPVQGTPAWQALRRRGR